MVEWNLQWPQIYCWVCQWKISENQSIWSYETCWLACFRPSSMKSQENDRNPLNNWHQNLFRSYLKYCMLNLKQFLRQVHWSRPTCWRFVLCTIVILCLECFQCYVIIDCCLTLKSCTFQPMVALINHVIKLN